MAFPLTRQRSGHKTELVFLYCEICHAIEAFHRADQTV